jgi:hypothetical protein
MLTHAGMWWADGHRFVRWSPDSRRVVHETRVSIESARTPRISRTCTNVRGHGGVKRSVVLSHAHLRGLPFVARFDVRSYYESINHDVLLAIIAAAQVESRLAKTVEQYLAIPDVSGRGRGMVAGGSLSPLLGAIYLGPLDQAMETLMHHGGLYYTRYADDFLIMARTRHLLRRAIARMHAVLADLRLTVHPEKRFIGRAERGCDFLGFTVHPLRRLEPSVVSIQLMGVRARRLYEQGADEDRLRRYVHRWFTWFTSGLGHLAMPAADETRYWRHAHDICTLATSKM